MTMNTWNTKKIYFCVETNKIVVTSLCTFLRKQRAEAFFLDVYSSYVGVKSTINPIHDISQTIKTPNLQRQQKQNIYLQLNHRDSFYAHFLSLIKSKIF